jgi:predicted Zn-dependent protease
VLRRSKETHKLPRRKALWALGVGLCAPASILSGCAVSPVTGQKILVGMGQRDELEVDRSMAAHQFSLDLGPIQDQGVNAYVSEVGASLHAQAHRRSLPYNYRVVNGNYLNAYTFPGGSMALTRGIMIELQNEAELAAVLGHELGHVNARHSAQQQGQAILATIALATIEAAARDSKNRDLIGIGSRIGASALLAAYSRDFEREADSLGQEYLDRSGYPAEAMTAVHQMLVRTERSRPGLLETMFSSHPMSEERVKLAQRLAETRYAESKGRPVQRERFMDRTVTLRALAPTIEANRGAELLMGRKKMAEAEALLITAAKRSQRDYPTHFRLAQVYQVLGNKNEALRYAKEAQSIYPQEPQAHKLLGVLHMERGSPSAALENFQRYDQFLSNDIGIIFLKAMAYESMGNRTAAAQHFQSFLKAGGSGEGAQYGTNRLKEWGYRANK